MSEGRIEITIPGKPIAKARPRFFRKGNFVGTYSSQETEEGKWMLEAKQQVYIEKLMEGSIALYIIFAMPVVKGWSKKKLRLLDETIVYHTKRPDLDNLVKFVKDCLNGIVWKDDSQICFLEAKKYYSLEPKTVIKIENWL